MYNILLVEDELEIQELVSEYLSAHGFNMYTASDGLNAIETFKILYDRLDGVLLDINLPGYSGYDVLHMIRQQSNVPVILLTARADERDKLKGLSMGADDYVVKPFSFAEISMRLKAQIRRNTEYAEPTAADIIRNGALSFDKKRHEAFKHGVAIHLHTKELHLFKLFMENVDQVFTQKKLYELIWDEPFYGDNNTIMVHISKLRDKIEDTPKKPRYITTVRGIGYRMERQYE